MTTRELKRLIADEGKVLQNTKTGKTATVLTFLLKMWIYGKRLKM